MEKLTKVLLLLVVVMFLVVGASRVNATIWTLSDKNSVAKIDSTSQLGMYDWFVDGKDYLHEPDKNAEFTGQWFWYRLGDYAPEASVDSLTLINEVGTDTHLELTYALIKQTGAEVFEILIKYDLTGGTLGSYTSDIAETIRIENKSNSALDFHFFQYTDFDIVQDNDRAQVTNMNRMYQRGPGIGVGFTETVATTPDHWQISYYRTIQNALNDGLPTNLSDTPILNTGIGPGDVTFSWQWNEVIGVGNSFIISKDKKIGPSVPIPSALLLLSSGLLGFLGIKRRTV